MGRKAQHAPLLLRNMIIDAAEAVVSEGGLALLSARELARRIGYSPGTIYNVYANLDDVILHVEARMLDRLAQRLAGIESQSPEDMILKLAHGYLTFTHENPRLWNLLFEHRLPPGEPLPNWYSAKLTGLLATIETALAPYFDPDAEPSRHRAARVLWSAVHGITSLSTSGKLSIITTEDSKLLVDDLVGHYLKGLARELPKARDLPAPPTKTRTKARPPSRPKTGDKKK